jgi:flagellar P-ring protein FlgI
MIKRLSFVIIFMMVFVLVRNEVQAKITVKLREIAYFDGLKENQVFGFGLVVGLQGTGDSKSALVESSLKSLLKSIGISEEEKYKSKNIAAVLLTANLPAFVRVGDKVDVAVSSIGDSK